MATLLVRLPHAEAGTGASVAYAWADRAQADASPLASAPVAGLPAGSGTVVLVPASRLAWHRVTLPRGSGLGRPGAAAERRLLSVLAGALEDRLLQEPNLLHFAVAPAAATPGPTGAKPEAGEGAWVAVAERAWLLGWLEALGQGRTAPQRIVPEWAPAVDEADAHVHVDAVDEQPRLLARSVRGCLALPLSRETLAGAFASLALPEGTTVSAHPAHAARAEALIAELGHGARQVEIVAPAQACAAAAAQGWDLAQFDLARRGSARFWRRVSAAASAWALDPLWRPMRWGLAVALLAQLIGLNLWAWQRERDLHSLRDQGRAIVTQVFPDIRLVVEPLAQMQREVAALRRRSGVVDERDLEPLLAQWADAWQQARPDAAIGTQGPRIIEYAGGELRLRGLNTGAADAQALQQRLAAAKVGVRAEGDVWTLTSTAGRGP